MSAGKQHLTIKGKEITPADSFVFYRSFADVIRTVDDETALALVRAICDYALDLKEPSLKGAAIPLFTLIRPQLEANMVKRACGKNNAPKDDIKQSKAVDKSNSVGTLDVTGIMDEFNKIYHP